MCRVAERDETFPELGGARLLLEIGCGDLADRDLLVEHPRVGRLDAVERALDRRLVCWNRALAGGDRGDESEKNQRVAQAERVHIRRRMGRLRSAGMNGEGQIVEGIANALEAHR